MPAPRLFVVFIVMVVCLHFQICEAFRMMNHVYSSPILGNRKEKSLSSLRYGKDALGFDTHQAVDAIPESLVRSIEGNDSMRRRFESLIRGAQVRSTH
jgi:hypothetical protein